MHRAIAERVNVHVWFTQANRAAVGKNHGDLGVFDPYAAFRQVACYRCILQLPAVGGLWHHATALQLVGVRGAGLDREPDQHRYRGAAGSGRWVAAAILDVAALTGVGIEQRAEASRAFC